MELWRDPSWSRPEQSGGAGLGPGDWFVPLGSRWRLLRPSGTQLRGDGMTPVWPRPPLLLFVPWPLAAHAAHLATSGLSEPFSVMWELFGRCPLGLETPELAPLTVPGFQWKPRAGFNRQLPSYEHLLLFPLHPKWLVPPTPPILGGDICNWGEKLTCQDVEERRCWSPGWRWCLQPSPKAAPLG